jgi:hypothetical protein
LSRFAADPEAALQGIRQVVADVVADLQKNGEPVPESLSMGKNQRPFQSANSTRASPAVGIGNSRVRHHPEQVGKR